MLHLFHRGSEEGMEAALARLVAMQYQRTNMDLYHVAFRVRGDVLEILPAYEDVGIRVEYRWFALAHQPTTSSRGARAELVLELAKLS